MDTAELNLRCASTFVQGLVEAGLREVCLAPGSRSAPLAIAFARHPAVRCFVHVDERSCAFFALGLAKATGRPVAVLCSSGTAAAEFHPAVIEASHSGVPLLVLTADRPPELLQVGANQAIDQSRIYGGAVRWHREMGPPADLAGTERLWRRIAARALASATGLDPGPVHVNLAFREPLVPAPGRRIDMPPRQTRIEVVRPAGLRVLPAALRGVLAAARRPLVVAGLLPTGINPDAAATLSGRAALLAEPTSQLRALPFAVAEYEAILRSNRRQRLEPDLVIRVGATPTSRTLNEFLDLPVPALMVAPGGRWGDPDQRFTGVIEAAPEEALAAISEALAEPEPGWLEGWAAAAATARAAIAGRLAELELFEGHVVTALAAALDRDHRPARVLLGSSLPVRAADYFWPLHRSGLGFLANRGASGIDGLVSTMMGAAAAGTRTVGLIGDLSLYHDMNGLWAARRHRLSPVLIVLDNDGGGIFEFLAHAEHTDVFEEYFATPLGLDFSKAADLYGFDFLDVNATGPLAATLDRALAAVGPVMVRVGYDRKRSVRAHREVWRAVTEALEAGDA